MPMYEHLPVKVTLTVEVDGHTLTFQEYGKAVGARYHGEAPKLHGYSTDDTLESSVRGTVDTCITKALARSAQFLDRAYPVAKS